MYLGLEGVEPVRPEAAIAGEPLVELGQRLRVERVQPAAPVLASSHETLLAEDPEVPGNARATGRELGGDLAGAALAFGEQLHDPPPRGIGERLECDHGPSPRCSRSSASTHQARYRMPTRSSTRA